MLHACMHADNQAVSRLQAERAEGRKESREALAPYVRLFAYFCNLFFLFFSSHPPAPLFFLEEGVCARSLRLGLMMTSSGVFSPLFFPFSPQTESYSYVCICGSDNNDTK